MTVLGWSYHGTMMLLWRYYDGTMMLLWRYYDATMALLLRQFNGVCHDGIPGAKMLVCTSETSEL
jgi:hypothetical protein